MNSLDIAAIRAQFPILHTSVRGKPLVYLDNAATTQKPQVVLDRIAHYYEAENANIHRAVHYLSEVATRRTEEARIIIARFLGIKDAHELIFTRGCTDGINLVAGSWGRANIGAGDEIILSAMEHHSNIVPWQILAAEKGAIIKVAPINEDGELLLDEFEALFSEKTKLVSIIHVSNALGTINPAQKIIEMAHARGVKVLLDAAQSVPHLKVDLEALNPDFFVFSGHKIYGPTGIGCLWARRETLEAMPPYQSGGDMISSVKWSGSTWNELPYKFEAGTPNMEGAIGLAAAIEWVESIGIDQIAAHENHLLALATDAVQDFPGLTIIGRAREKASVLSFTIAGAHPNDIGTLLDARGVAIRTGHHCTQPLMERFGLPATARASFAVYNTEEEVEKFVYALEFAREMLG
ncbi:MAG TPA: cysteine desulfurase [Abditibacterium sp.]|jgi:cysteine desulfurase/selenocysteine lyase